jgi:[ribosomal protein S5]-alanine N-acetyltransferase
MPHCVCKDAAMSILDPEPWSTDRLTLRPVRLGDAEAISAYASDPEVTKYLVFAPHRSLADADEFLRMAVERNSTMGASRTFLIERKADGIAIGSFDVRPEDGRVEIGYAIARRFWNQGYATEALREALALLLAEPRIYRVEAYHDMDNPASGRVMEKAGMSREGVLRNHSVHPNVSTEPRDMILYAAVKQPV